MQFGVLGPLAVTTDTGEPVTVPGAKVRVLLADLLANRNQVVSADRLIDDLWGDDPPANAAGALQVRVSQLRKALNDAEPGARDLIESRAPGYRLRTLAIDADSFAELADATDADRLGAALRLWRGEPYADMADEEFTRAEATRLTEQRLAVLERLADARLARGEHDLVAADLAELVARHPLREGLRALHMRALYAAGRQSEALDSYADLRARLADELGLDPGPDLVALHQRILEQDAGLAAAPRAVLIRTGLPARLDDLIGRATALTELGELIGRHRLVTLTGPGGVGKTRLATEAARELTFPDGSHLVELAPLPAGDVQIADRVLAALDLREVAGAAVSAEDRLVTAVRDRRLLLVLDNCEHVIDGVAELVGRLLRDAPEVTLLATSREPLGLRSEQLWEVPPLAVPADGDLGAVSRSAAARLFVARASALHRGFRLDERTAPAVAQLCLRLDGLPLALELAATRVRALGVQGVVDRLDDRFKLLTSTQRDVPARQRTLTAVIAWSWDLLDEPDREVLARLAVFHDGCTADAAEEVCGADLDALTRLVDRSLVVLDDSGAAPRYRLLESVSAFALTRLADPAPARAAFAAYFTALAERADPELRGAGQHEWLTRLDAETANLKAALHHGGGARLAVALSWYWVLRGRLTEARTALALDGAPADRTRAAAWRAGFELLLGAPVKDPRTILSGYADSRVTWFIANALTDRGELEVAAGLLTEALTGADSWVEAAVLATRAKLSHIVADQVALERDATRSFELFAALGDRWGQLQAGDWLGGLVEMRGEHERAAELHRDGLRWAEELRLWPDVCGKLSWLAWTAVQTRDYPAGRELGERAYRMAVEQGNPAAIVFAELSLGFGARRDGKLDLAEVHLRNIVATGRAEAQPAVYLPMVLVELGYAAEQGGDPAAGLALHREAFDLAAQTGSLRDGVSAIEGMASSSDSPDVSARLLGAAAVARVELAAPASPAERDEIDRISGRLVAALGPDRFAELHTAGNDLSPGEARALV